MYKHTVKNAVAIKDLSFLDTGAEEKEIDELAGSIVGVPLVVRFIKGSLPI
jgi:hypothetical protein